MVFRLFEKTDDLCPADRREAVEKIVNGFSSLQIVEQGLHRHPSAGKHQGTAHHVGVAKDNRLFHAVRLPPSRRPMQPLWSNAELSGERRRRVAPTQRVRLSA